MGNKQLGIPQTTALALAERLRIKTFIETGTYRAGTSLWAHQCGQFERVITIEGYRKRYDGNIATYGLHSLPGLEFVYGDSRTKLAEILKTVSEPAVFWLDAHWCGDGALDSHAIGDECPLREELLAINDHKAAPSHVILIDDARLFIEPPPYPHHPEQWPTMQEVEALLKHHARGVEVKDDVIWAVPYFHEVLLHNLW
jgi:hypothetical protein